MTESSDGAAVGTLLLIQRKLKERRRRAIDIFRELDTSGDGSISVDEFFGGLQQLQVELTAEEFEVLMRRLDKDGSGDVTLKEFDRAIKAAERASRADGADGVQLPSLSTPKATPRRTPRKTPKCEAWQPKDEGTLDAADEFLLQTIAKLNAEKKRMIDLFRRMDRSGDGVMSVAEFKDGLQGMSLKPTVEEFRLLVRKLDKDRSGDVSISEFDQALRRAKRLAEREGRGSELEAWHGKRKESGFAATDWSLRNAGGMGSKGETMRSANSSWYASGLSDLLVGGGGWSVASGGPAATASASLVGSGSIVDSSIFRLRYFDHAPNAPGFAGALDASPGTIQERAECRPKTFAHASRRGRFAAEPPSVVPAHLKRKTLRCATALRPNVVNMDVSGGVKTFGNAPMMQSSVDQVVFGRDMDFSGDTQFDEDFTAMFEGHAGMPSWRWGR